jgi:hypothetical protein
MPRRSSVDLLPDDDKSWLDKALVQGAFSGYEALAEALQARGFGISRSALQRYGSKFEGYLEKVKQASHHAAAIAEALPDDAGRMGDAVTQMLQAKVMDLLIDMDVQVDNVKFTDLISSVAKLNASSVQQKKWASEVKVKTKTAAEEVAKVVKAAGLTPQAVSEIRTKILGIAK